LLHYRDARGASLLERGFVALSVAGRRLAA